MFSQKLTPPFSHSILQLGQAAISIKLTHYFSDYWNQIDMIMYPLFVVATILLFPSDTRETAKILLAVALFLFYFRLLNAFTISRTIGPKVLMIFKMVRCPSEIRQPIRERSLFTAGGCVFKGVNLKCCQQRKGESEFYFQLSVSGGNRNYVLSKQGEPEIYSRK